MLAGRGTCDPIKNVVDLQKYGYKVQFPRFYGQEMDVHFTNTLLQVAAEYEENVLKDIITENPTNRSIEKRPGPVKKITEFSLYLKENFAILDHCLLAPKNKFNPLSEIDGENYHEYRLEAIGNLSNLQFSFDKRVIQKCCVDAIGKNSQFVITQLDPITKFVIQVSVMTNMFSKKKCYLSEILLNLPNLRIGVTFKNIGMTIDSLKICVFLKQHGVQFPPPKIDKNAKYLELLLPEDKFICWCADRLMDQALFA